MPAPVWMFAAVSLLNEVSAQMVAPLIPILLVAVLSAEPVALGAVERRGRRCGIRVAAAIAVASAALPSTGTSPTRSAAKLTTRAGVLDYRAGGGHRLQPGLSARAPCQRRAGLLPRGRVLAAHEHRRSGSGALRKAA